MKNKMLIMLALVFVAGRLIAQDEEVAQFSFRYKFTYVYDLTKKDRPYKEDRMVLIGKNSFMDKTYYQIGYTKMMLAQQKEKKKERYLRFTDTTMEQTYTGREFIFFPDKKAYYEVNRIVKDAFLFQKDFPEVTWDLLNDTLTIGGHLCKKATGRFAGRNYTAWYSTDLPYQGGPWKLNGLPGVILSAFDDKQEVKFEFYEELSFKPEKAVEEILSADSTKDDNEYISLPSHPRKLTDEQYRKYVRIMADAPIQFVSSTGAGYKKVPVGTKAEKKNVGNFFYTSAGLDAYTITNPLEITAH